MNDKERELRRQSRFEKQQNNREGAIELKKTTLDRHAQKYQQNRAHQEEISFKLDEFLEQERDFLDTSIKEKIGYFFVLWVPFCVYCFNTLLIYQPIDYLVTKHLGSGTLAIIAKFVLPIALIVFYFGMATMIYYIKDPENSVSFAKVAILITPCMLLATNLTYFIYKKTIPNWGEILLLAALILLTLVGDLILFQGIRIIYTAFAFYCFWFSLSFLKSQRNRSQQESHKSFVLVKTSYEQYMGLLNSYNHYYAETPIQPPSFTHIPQEIVDRLPPQNRSTDK